MQTVQLQPLRKWRESSHVPHRRRASPNEMYTSGQDLINHALTRIALLHTSPVLDVPVLPVVAVENILSDTITTKSYQSPVDAVDEYEFLIGPLAEREVFFTRDGNVPVLLNFPRQQDAEVSLAGVIATTPVYQDTIFVDVNKLHVVTKISVYREYVALDVVKMAFRDVDRTAEHAEDAIRFIDGSTVGVEDLVWHYNFTTAQVVRESQLWAGMLFPVRIRDSNLQFVGGDDPGTDLLTYIIRPYVAMTLKFRQPPIVDEEVVLLAETKYSILCVSCQVPATGVSIGVPVVGDYSGMIVRLHTEGSMLHQIDVLAYDYPFRTSLADAVPLLPMVDIDFASLFAVDDLDPVDIGSALARDARKDWIEGEAEESVALVGDKLESTTPRDWPLRRFLLRHRQDQIDARDARYEGSVMVVRPPALWLPAKKKARMHVSYVFDGSAHKRGLKFKLSNNTDPRSYLFELPGPLHLRLVLAPNEDASAHLLSEVFIDTLRRRAAAPPPLQPASTSTLSSSLAFSSSSSEDDSDDGLESIL